jgi:hypothetical protein
MLTAFFLSAEVLKAAPPPCFGPAKYSAYKPLYITLIKELERSLELHKLQLNIYNTVRFRFEQSSNSKALVAQLDRVV